MRDLFTDIIDLLACVGLVFTIYMIGAYFYG